jgi:hypothetical protein
MELGEHLDAFFHSQLSKIEAAIAFWVTAWQKTSSVQTRLVFKPKNHSKSLLGPYEGKLLWQFCSGDIVQRWRQLSVEDWKIQFTSIFPLFNATGLALDCKMTWFHPKMPFPQRVWLLFGSLSRSKFGDEISSVADPGCLSRIYIFSIPDSWSRIQIFSILDPGSWIRIKEFKYFNQKKIVFKLSKIWSGFFIPDLDPGSGSWLSPIPDPESLIRIRNTGDFRFALAVGGSIGYWLSTGAAV